MLIGSKQPEKEGAAVTAPFLYPNIRYQMPTAAYLCTLFKDKRFCKENDYGTFVRNEKYL